MKHESSRPSSAETERNSAKHRRLRAAENQVLVTGSITDPSAGGPSTAVGGAGGGSSGLIELLLMDSRLSPRKLTYPPQAVVHESGADAAELFFLHSGQVRISRASGEGSTMLLEILGSGQWFGSASLVGNATFDTRAMTAVTSVVSSVNVERVLGVLSEHTDATLMLIRQLAGREMAARREASRFVFDDCQGRLLDALLKFSTSPAAVAQAEGVTLRITHEQLAQAVGVARETVSLALTDLRKENLIRTGRNQLVFDPAAIRQFQIRRKK